MEIKTGEKFRTTRSVLLRADFDFESEANGIKRCAGYVICKDVVLTENGSYTFGVDSVVLQKLIATKPDFEIIEQLAIKNCKLFDDEIINVGSLADHHD